MQTGFNLVDEIGFPDGSPIFILQSILLYNKDVVGKPMHREKPI